MTGIILEFYELKRIWNYLKISTKKNDTTLPKIKEILDSMEKHNRPVCKIVVENSS